MIARARAVLRLLEGEQLVVGLSRDGGRDSAPAIAHTQLGLFAELHPVVGRLRSIDANQMTPMEALKVLDDLAQMARRGEVS